MTVEVAPVRTLGRTDGQAERPLRLDLRGEPGVARNLKAVRRAVEHLPGGQVLEILTDDPVIRERLAGSIPDLFPVRLLPAHEPGYPMAERAWRVLRPWVETPDDAQGEGAADQVSG
ncbi:MAG: hypothetical protein M0031_12425 [Thermaerobacter sp.]|nr:hypothetical protein [Thermaerobacter sp.]